MSINEILNNIGIMHKRKTNINDLINLINVKSRPKVVILGGGPVGLFTALKLSESNLFDITLIEKRSEYTREEIFMIQNSIMYQVLDYLPNNILQELINVGCFILPPAYDSDGVCFKSIVEIKEYLDGEGVGVRPQIGITNYPARLLGIKIKLFESILFDNLKKQHNIRILRPVTKPTEKVTSANIDVNGKTWDVYYENIIIKASDYDIIIGAEGSNSIVRDKILNDARNPETNEELFGHFLTPNKNKNSLLASGKIKDDSVLSHSYIKASYIIDKFNAKDKYGDPYALYYAVGYGLVAHLDMDNKSEVYKEKMENELYTRAEYNNLRQIDNEISNQIMKNSISSLINPKYFVYNLKTTKDEFGMVNGVNNQEVEPQHRYRLFTSHENKWYFGINLSRSEYDEISAMIVSNMSEEEEDELKKERKEFKLIPLKKIKNDIIFNNKSLYLAIASLLKYYNIKKYNNELDEFIRKIEFSSFPLILYKASYFMSCKKIGDSTKICAIVGDAIVGVHYFSGTGVNLGIKCAKKLVDRLVHFTKTSNTIDRYENTKDACIQYNKEVSTILSDGLKASLNVSLDFDSMDSITDLKNVKCSDNQVITATHRTDLTGNKMDLIRCNRRADLIEFITLLKGKIINGIAIDDNDVMLEINKIIYPELNFGDT